MMIRSLATLTALFLGAQVNAQSICQIQGSGASSPYDGMQVTTTGTVTALFTGANSVGGYFIEQSDCDSDPSTSNGVFVYATSPGSVAVGQRLQVTGTVVEFNGLTEITNASATLLGTGTITPTTIELPLPSVGHWERYEGMLIRFPATLVVTGNQSWVQYGEVWLSPQRQMTPTNFIDPNDAVASGTNSTGSSNAGAITAELALQARNRILLDDGRTNSFPIPLPWVGAEGTLRTGSTIVGLTGVLHYRFGEYRLQPVGSVPIVHAPRPAVPAVGGTVRAASMNLLNYWTTLGGWGAANSGELGRQRTKTLAALQTMNADVLALHELENNDVAWADLLAALNSAMGAGTYTALEVDAFGSGGTKSVIFYKPSRLTPVTDLFSVNGSPFQRPHLTQGFAVVGNGGRFLFSTTHLRSKLCDGATGANQDQGDGQGCYNGNRRDQANALVAHWSGLRSSTGIQAQLIMGDFNAHTEEDPADILRAGGLQRSLAASAYSYYYEGAFGALDHAFASNIMASAITGAEMWHINSDEPAGFSYTDSNLSRYQPNAFRSSDHDPVVVGFNAAQLPVVVPELAARSPVRFALIDGTMGQWTMDVPMTAEVFVYNASGAMVRATKGSQSGSISMPLTGLSSGVHLWHIIGTNGSVHTGRFVYP